MPGHRFKASKTPATVGIHPNHTFTLSKRKALQESGWRAILAVLQVPKSSQPLG
jgi:hypothetical protein